MAEVFTQGICRNFCFFGQGYPDRPSLGSIILWQIKGTSSLEVYDGRIMADVGDVVIVSMNYRYEEFMAS